MPKRGIQTFIRFKVSTIAIVLLVMLSARRVSSLSSTMSSKATKKPQPQQPTALPLHIHWFRQDLRLLDNPALNKTIKNSMSSSSPENDISKGIIPIYCFDPRFVGGNTMTPFGSQKCGVIRAKFLLDSVIDLRNNLEKKGSGLVVAYGKPEEVLSKLCKALQDELAAGKDDSEQEEPAAQTTVLLKPSVVVQEEPASEEYQVDRAVQRATKTFASGSLETVWAATLYDPEDLPFDKGVQGMPDTFTPFRNKVEKVSSKMLLLFFYIKKE